VRLRDALNLCSDDHAHAWVNLPGGPRGRPATTMLAGVFDVGANEPAMRPLDGHSIAVYEPDARLSLVWPVDDEPEVDCFPEQSKPEWLNADGHEWKSARQGWVVVLLGGAPVWQESLRYLDWGSAVGGYVPDFQPVYGEDRSRGTPDLAGWTTSRWAVGLAGLINSFSHSTDFASFDPTYRVVPAPDRTHPIDARCDH
jgi:hypothetical protein